MINNFTNHLYTLAFAHAKEHNLPVETLFAIMKQGPDKAIAMGPKAAQPDRQHAATSKQSTLTWKELLIQKLSNFTPY